MRVFLTKVEIIFSMNIIYLFLLFYIIFFYDFVQLSEGRALYNLGNVYHAKGKQAGRIGNQDPGEFPEDVRQCLQQAVRYYE